jgi:TM2 domain-containing membrane protein YozV/RNA polymerase subunit RPABC4/transcription elongation factor Spt4
MFCRNCGKEVPQQAVFCPGCGSRSLTGSNFCQNCGTQVNLQAEVCVKCGARLAKPEKNGISTKSRLATTLLALFLGVFGAHRFYAGKVGTAIVMLILGLIGFFTVWLFSIGLIFIVAVSIWAFVDFIFCAAGRFKDDGGLPIEKW